MTEALTSLRRMTGCLVEDAKVIWVVRSRGILGRWRWLKWFEKTGHEKLFID